MKAFRHCSVPLRLCALSSLLVAGAILHAAETTAPDAAKPEIPIISLDESVQKELMNLDRMLDTNPKLEETLRTNLDKLTEQTFRAQNPDIDALIKRNPGIVPALRAERHHFVHRAVARLARSRVTRKDAIALDEFLSEHRDIARALQRRPSQIVEADFLIAHPELGTFFEAHPGFSSVLLQRADKGPSATKSGQKKK